MLVAGLQADGPDIGDECIRARRDRILADFSGFDQFHSRGDTGKPVIDDFAGPVLRLFGNGSGPDRAATATGVLSRTMGKRVHDLAAMAHREVKMKEFGIAG